uniref:Uncharacterized protein n=1 Tax=Romanomermis culicivorax TaxID=13658 RepID=A0A915L8B9_ROMCU
MIIELKKLTSLNSSKESAANSAAAARPVCRDGALLRFEPFLSRRRDEPSLLRRDLSLAGE